VPRSTPTSAFLYTAFSLLIFGTSQILSAAQGCPSGLGWFGGVGGWGFGGCFVGFLGFFFFFFLGVGGVGGLVGGVLGWVVFFFGIRTRTHHGPSCLVSLYQGAGFSSLDKVIFPFSNSSQLQKKVTEPQPLWFSGEPPSEYRVVSLLHLSR